MIGDAFQRGRVGPGPGHRFHAPVDRHEQVTDPLGVRLGIEVALALCRLDTLGIDEVLTMDPLPERGMDGVAAPNCAEPLARRRRHAWPLATLTELIGDCAQAAGEVYRPVAEAPPNTQTDVPVNLGVLGGLCRYSGGARRALRTPCDAP